MLNQRFSTLSTSSATRSVSTSVASGLMLVLVVATLALNSGCSPSEADALEGGTTGSREIASSQLSGTFNNKPFTLGKAIASRIIDSSGEQIMITFAPLGFDFGCAMAYPDIYVGASAPSKPGSYTVDFQDQVRKGERPLASAVFTTKGETTRALIASQATVRIDQISAREVRGGLSAQAKDGPNTYDVSGEFVAEICN